MSLSSILHLPEPINEHIKIFFYEHAELHSPVITAACNQKIWEKKLFNIYKNMIQPDDTIVDVGAFIGSHTLIFSKLAHNGNIIAFEPCRKPFEALTKSLDYNDMKNVKLLKNIVTNKINDEEIMGSTYDGDSSIQRLRPRKKFLEYETIKTTTIDSLNLKRCDLIKIDAENAEWLVMEGAENTINKHRPIIFFETFKKPNGEHLRKLEEWTIDHYYNYTHLKGDDYLLESI